LIGGKGRMGREIVERGFVDGRREGFIERRRKRSAG
jgi:hypothetical protein